MWTARILQKVYLGPSLSVGARDSIFKFGKKDPGIKVKLTRRSVLAPTRTLPDPWA